MSAMEKSATPAACMVLMLKRGKVKGQRAVTAAEGRSYPHHSVPRAALRHETYMTESSTRFIRDLS